MSLFQPVFDMSMCGSIASATVASQSPRAAEPVRADVSAFELATVDAPPLPPPVIRSVWREGVSVVPTRVSGPLAAGR